MNKKTSAGQCLLLFIYCFISTLSAAQAATLSISLHDAILLSMRYNPNVHNAEIQRIVDRYALTTAYYAFQPQLSASGQIQHSESVSQQTQDSTQNTINLTPQAELKTHLGTKYSLQFNNPVTNGTYQPTISLNINQPLLRGSKRVVILQSLYDAIDNETVNKLQLKDAVINTINQVIQDYLTVIQDYQTLKVDQHSLKSAQETVEQNKIRIKAGTMAPTENTRLRAEIPSRKLSLARDINNIKKDKRKLLDDIGLDPTLDFEIEQNFNYYPTQLPKEEQSINQGLKNNINYQISRINLHAIERNYLKAKDDEHWQLDAFANITRGGNSGIQSIHNNTSHSEAIGLNLTIPIGNVNLHNATIAAKIRLQQEQTNLATQKRQLLINIQNNINDLTTQKEQIKLAKQNQALQYKTLMEAQKKAAHGRTSMFEVSTEQNNLTISEQQVVDSKIAFLRAYANFDVLLGTALKRWNITLIN